MNAKDAIKKIKAGAETLSEKVKAVFGDVAKVAKSQKSGNNAFQVLEETFGRIVEGFVKKVAELEGGDKATLDEVRAYADRIRAAVDSLYGLLGRWIGVPFGGDKFAAGVEAVKLAVDELDDLIDQIDDAAPVKPAAVAKAPRSKKAKPEGSAAV